MTTLRQSVVPTLICLGIMLNMTVGMINFSAYCNLAIAVPISVFTMRFISSGFVALGMSATVRDVTNGFLLLMLLTISANQGLIERIRQDKKYAEQARAEYEALQTQ